MAQTENYCRMKCLIVGMSIFTVMW